MATHNAYWDGRADNITGKFQMPLLVTDPNLRVARYDAAHLLRPSAATLAAERKRAENRERCALRRRDDSDVAD